MRFDQPVVRLAALLIALAPHGVRAQCSSHPRFRPPALYFGNPLPRGLAVGDLNQDGVPDLVVGNQSFGGIRIHLGIGDGTFSGYNIGVDGAPRGVALADFNGDEHLDIATAGYARSIVTILLGDGQGSFSGGVDFPAGADPLSIATGDFNGDGTPDIVVAGADAGIAVLLGNGQGGLAAPSRFLTSTSGLVSVVVRDFNGDGRSDIAVVGGSLTWVLLNAGNATFSNPQPYPTFTSSATSVAAGDYDRDGIPDLLVTTADEVTGGDGGNIRVFRGKGDGTFMLAGGRLLEGGLLPYAGAFADVDLDGKVDLVLSVRDPSKARVAVAVLPGDGQGAFEPAVLFPLAFGQYPYSLVVADLDGGGAPDVAMTAFAGTEPPNGVAVFLSLQRAATNFFPLAPCRALDTRIGPTAPLVAGSASFLTLAGSCSVPTSARAVAANVTVVSPSEAGFVVLFPGATSSSPTSTISFRAGAVRANNALLVLDGSCGVNASVSAGTTHLVVDVVGYFE